MDLRSYYVSLSFSAIIEVILVNNNDLPIIINSKTKIINLYMSIEMDHYSSKINDL
jgi:hypothetical protein